VAPARLRIRLRAAFGVNARADILAALLAAPVVGLSIADLARTTRFTKPNVASAVDALVLAGLLDARTVGNERRLTLTRADEILPGLTSPVVQPDWVTRFGVALEVLRFTRQEGMSPSVRAIEGRRIVEGLRTRILAEGLPQPNTSALGDQFADAFDRWVVQLVDFLRSPSQRAEAILWDASAHGGRDWTRAELHERNT
jgi:hypothetical protein